MKKKFVIIMWWCLTASVVIAQKYDYNWLAGYGSEWGYDTSGQYWFGITKFDFTQQQVAITRDSLGIYFNRANVTISDSDANLLFYSNGVRINNYLDELIPNGDSLGWGPNYTYYAPYIYQYGQAYPQISITLTSPKFKNTFDLFYDYIDTTDQGVDLVPTKLLMARVDMNANNGHGTVVFKDSLVYKHRTNGVVTAVKHGNGRDWWLCTGRLRSNCYNVMLYDGSGSVVNTIQCGGDSMRLGHIYSERFSPDGSVFVMASDEGPVSVFDFDRCSGTLSLREEFIISEIADSIGWWPTGLEFSADSRFFYVCCDNRIFQYDLQVNPIASSKDTIAKYSGFMGPNPQGLYYAQLAPDGKIYVNSGNTNFYIGVIDSPEGQGASCHFIDHGIQLPTFISGLPYYPNYRLGALAGSPCDTLTVISNELQVAKEKTIKVFPNPATDYVVVDYGFTDWSKGEIYLEITDELGQTVYEEVLPMYSGFRKINISSYAAGVYMAYIKRQGGLVGVAKFAKE